MSRSGHNSGKIPGKRRLWRGALLLVAAVVIMIQLFPVPHTNPPVESDLQAPEAVKKVLVESCYDCHSNQTVWPWYSRVAPVSWWVVSHVTRGRKDLNFSEWPTFDLKAQDHIMREIRTQVKSGQMPLPSYIRGHAEAALTDEKRKLILDWVEPVDDSESWMD